MKNLVLMHLESLNKLNYKMNEQRFAFLHDFERKCESYIHYYSTATSTLMVLSDLQYGSTYRFEACKSLDDVPEDLDKEESLFDELKKEGYDARVLVYPSSGDISGAERRHFLGQTVSAEEIFDYDAYISEIDKTINNDKFAIHIVPTISNVAENKVVDVSEDDDCTFWDEGYRVLNVICEHVVSKLEELEKLKDTVIIFYGDHGDDYWGHGLHGGLTHAIEPNNLLISTPLFVWDGEDRNNILNEEIVQTSDLKDLIKKKLNSEDYTSSREYAFSRNEYAGQDMRLDTFNKAYSITDGRYMLLVSGHGLEMYDTVMDPGCLTNLLQFFQLEGDTLVFNLNKAADYRYHIKFYWGARQQRIVRESYNRLKTELIGFIKKSYEVTGNDHFYGEIEIESIRRSFE